MYYNNEPITRIEKFLAATYRDDVSVPDPVTRIESYMNSILSGNASDLEPTTRIERYLAKISGAVSLGYDDSHYSLKSNKSA